MIRDSFHMSVVNCTGKATPLLGRCMPLWMSKYHPHPSLGSGTMTQLIVLQFCVVTSHGVAVLLRWSQGSCADPIGLPLLSKAIVFQQSEDLTELNLTKSCSSSPQLWDGWASGVGLRHGCKRFAQLQLQCYKYCWPTHVCHWASSVCSSVSAVQSRDEAQAKSLEVPSLD